MKVVTHSGNECKLSFVAKILREKSIRMRERLNMRNKERYENRKKEGGKGGLSDISLPLPSSNSEQMQWSREEEGRGPSNQILAGRLAGWLAGWKCGCVFVWLVGWLEVWLH